MIAHLFFLAWYRVIILQLLPFDEVNAWSQLQTVILLAVVGIMQKQIQSLWQQS